MDRTIGTKRHFRDWLQAHKGLTYTAYSKLSVKDKLAIHEERKGKP